jgi:membrane-bound ClpP family serine protease
MKLLLLLINALPIHKAFLGLSIIACLLSAGLFAAASKMSYSPILVQIERAVDIGAVVFGVVGIVGLATTIVKIIAHDRASQDRWGP